MKSLYFFVFLTLFSSLTLSEEISEESALEVSDFFRRPVVEHAELSPNGEFVAYERFGSIFVGNADVPYVEIYGVNNRFRIKEIIWLSDSDIAVQIQKKSNGAVSTQIVGLRINESSVRIDRDQFIANEGYIVDPLLHDPSAFLFAQFRVTDDKVFSDVHKIPLYSKKTYRFKKKSKYNYNSGEIINWITSASGSLRLGMSYENRIPTLWNRTRSKSRKMKRIWTGEVDTEFTVYGINSDFTKAWVVTDYKRDKSEAVIFNLETAEIESVIFKHPTYDVQSIVMDSNREKPLAITYLDKGRLNYHFIEPKSASIYEALQSDNPDHKFSVFDSDVTGSSMLLVKSGQSEPGVLLHCKGTNASCSMVTPLYPWLSDTPLSKTEVFTTKINDSTTIEAFLSYPPETDKNIAKQLPLIIMPHGGPIGVFDTQHFTGDVEWLVNNGYAVMRVNYRGSGGYGNTFEASGMQQWGRAIEQDISAAVSNAYALYSFLDSDRVCLFGASYGGYSAIMGIIQQPERYRCAISFAGVTDLSLLFNKSSIQNNEELTEIIKSIVGDPESEMANLQAFSPVYNATKVQRPLLLIHGSKDDIVDVEHSWRLSHMLKMYGIEHELVTMNGVNHSFTSTKQIKDFYEHVMPFLKSHLLDNETKLSTDN